MTTDMQTFPSAQVVEVYNGNIVKVLVQLGFSLPDGTGGVETQRWIRLLDVRSPQNGAAGRKAKACAEEWINQYAPDRKVSLVIYPAGPVDVVTGLQINHAGIVISKNGEVLNGYMKDLGYGDV